MFVGRFDAALFLYARLLPQEQILSCKSTAGIREQKTTSKVICWRCARNGKNDTGITVFAGGARARGTESYVTLSETKDELGDVAESHGWSLQGLDLYEFEATERRFKPEEEYTVFRPEDAELVQDVYQQVERIQPVESSLIPYPRCACWREIRSDTVVRSCR